MERILLFALPAHAACARIDSLPAGAIGAGADPKNWRLTSIREPHRPAAADMLRRGSLWAGSCTRDQANSVPLHACRLSGVPHRFRRVRRNGHAVPSYDFGCTKQVQAPLQTAVTQATRRPRRAGACLVDPSLRHSGARVPRHSLVSVPSAREPGLAPGLDQAGRLCENCLPTQTAEANPHDRRRGESVESSLLRRLRRSQREPGRALPCSHQTTSLRTSLRWARSNRAAPISRDRWN